MSRPNPYPPGAYYTLERCVLDRQFRLRPDEELNAAIAIAMHDACLATGVELIVWAVMSNHLHVLLRDVEGRLGEWLAHVLGLIGRFLNARHGVNVGTPLWDRRGHNATRIQGPERIIDRAAYILANPVAARQVRSPWRWPGLITGWEHLGRGTGPTYARPTSFFRGDGPVSERGELRSHAPAGMDVDAFRRQVQAQLEDRVQRARREMEAAGRGFPGPGRVRGLDPFSGPRTRRPRRAGRAVDARPTLLGGSREETMAMAAAREDFRERYAEALARLRARVEAVTFPPGTYRLWRFYGVPREDYAPEVLGVILRT